MAKKVKNHFQSTYYKYLIYDSCLYELKLSGKYISSASIENIKLLRVIPQELISLLLMNEVDLFNIPSDMVQNIININI